MKKWLMIACLFYAIMATPTLADDADVLQNRLNKVISFHASFSQQVTNAEGRPVQEGEGELWVKRPNLFNWHMTFPDENILISDGKTLWFYNPLVEQATANWLKNATDNTPFMLITCNSSSDWRRYNVKQQGDNFSLVPKSNNANLKQFMVKVIDDGTIEGFTAIEQDGQRIDYRLKSQNNIPVNIAKFHFIPPKGVTLDDQRH
ncbi:MAG: outer membrane lipoprotein carrier protein [Sodalis sp. Fse]|nr:MAG: outer membrane lipoprotein carrier protein [Sodalis sp. Fse]